MEGNAAWALAGLTTVAAAAAGYYIATRHGRKQHRGGSNTGLSGPMTHLDLHFEHAAAFVASSKKLSNEDKLVLYAFFKQASMGDCSAPKPSAIDFVAKAKWDAWMGLLGMSRNEAKKRYIEVVSSSCNGYSFGAPIADAVGTSDDESDDGSSSSGGFSMGGAASQVVVDKTTKEWQVVENAFHYASTGNADEVQAFLAANERAIDEQDDDGRTMLHWAVDRAQTEMAASLLAQGANVNAQDKDGMTPLHYAVLCEHLPLVDLLMTHGADMNLGDGDGESAYASASASLRAHLEDLTK
ncbi:hypothetical protein SPRG_10305 [Saprolegnia parasitica CBS 223.65]|uniref:ACB domain-containing protein n=1 Tax=Saprolegnia parasitica (strain CBS 223.65) TaxID=695850 RepID=A0A067C114_SAPPC|nr:hypothetical protein SPRG_10305 [Saprolegnia parasitica CBS 223.65]KDO24489.1 hypothetical protein SPRG_10305 [Saprolegnia parasitica CBS 223.65]|eukprot:XP_012204755.1 hypothetical protein SPRG_10305 [Saprolegnia parasitica CBS 223.65]